MLLANRRCKRVGERSFVDIDVGRRGGHTLCQNLCGKKWGKLVWSKPGREKVGGKILVKTWAGKSGGKYFGQNLGGEKWGKVFWLEPGR